MKSIITGKWRLLCALLGLLVGSFAYGDTAGSSLKAIPLDKVKLEDGFWQSRLETHAATIQSNIEHTAGVVESLRIAGRYLKGLDNKLTSYDFWGISDLSKVMEGAAYHLAVHKDPDLEKQMDDLIDIIADAQREDGYIHIMFLPDRKAQGCYLVANERTGMTPYSKIGETNETYNLGHMYEGASAYYLATGKDKWLKVAEKNARHVNRVFFEGDSNYNGGKPVMQASQHEEIEMGLCKLYLATGNKLYLQMAQKFIDIRGVTEIPPQWGNMGPEYAQQHKPVRDQRKAVGHAVRFGYLFSGVADVAGLTGDASYMPALDGVWSDVVNTQIYITGAVGSGGSSEGYGAEYYLPNRRAYNETCAAIANVFFNFRMYLLTGDAVYFDVAEISLLNTSLAGVNIAGNKFFYCNPLEFDGKANPKGRGGRSAWFGCACCPTNIARLIPQIPEYMYAYTEDEINITLYASSEVMIPLKSGKVGITQKSDYPFDGKVEFEVHPEKDQKFALKLRIPTWARTKQFMPGDLYYYTDNIKPKWTLSVNSKSISPKVKKGFASVKRNWKAGDKIVLNLPMPVRFNGCIDKVKFNKNRTAVTRGPLVYAAEQIDNDGPVQRFFISNNDQKTQIKTIESGILKGVTTVSLKAKDVEKDNANTPINMIPYYAWSNRGDNQTMILWIPDNAKLAEQNMNHIKRVTR